MNNLYTTLKLDLAGYLLAKDEVAKNILRVVLGELDMINSKRDVTHDDCIKTIRKCVEANNEVIKIKPCHSEKLLQENEILTAYLPNELNVEQIYNYIKDIELGNNIGKAVGVAVKFIREKGLHANGKDVRMAVEQRLGENLCS